MAEISNTLGKQKNNMEQTQASFFDRLSFLNQSAEKKEEIAQVVLIDSKGDHLYWIQIILSTLIATFGLLQNSVAVIIGAMLIAPLIRPMQAMSFAISTGRSHFFWQATWFLVKSVGLSIAIACCFAFIIPIKTETTEILARITPNILDLFIATFSAIIAILALAYKRLSESVAGVAMAASLMPPLAVVGIEITLGNFISAWGGFLLFFVNFLAILMVGVVVFFFYGFTPHQEIQKKMSVRKIWTLLIIILFTCIPLYSSLSNISLKIKSEKQVSEILHSLIPEKIEEGTVSNIEVINVDEDSITLKGNIQVPENIKIFQSTYDSILQELETQTNKKVSLDFQMIRTANLSSPNQTEIEKRNISDGFNTLLQKKFPVFTPLQIELLHKEDNTWSIQPIVSLPNGEYLEEAEKEEFEIELSNQFPNQKFIINWVTIANSKQKTEDIEPSAEEILQESIPPLVKEHIKTSFSEDISIENIIIIKDDKENIFLTASVYYPEEKVTIAPIKTTEENFFFPEEKKNIPQEKRKEISDSLNSFLKTLPYQNIQSTYRFFPYQIAE